MNAVDGLSIRALRVERDGQALLDIPTLHAPPAACTVITGAGDAGKTLLAATLAGAVPGARGEVRLGGEPVTGPPSARRRRGLAAVPGDPPRLRGVSVTEALALAARRGRHVADVFDKFSLLAARRRLACDRLSGGEHQLLRIACAWASTPRALVLDSPTAGLAAAMADLVVGLAREEADRGAAVLWLDQPGQPAPAAAALRIAGGRISVAAAS